MNPKTYQTCLRCTIMACCFLFGIGQRDLFAESPILALQETIDRLQHILHDPGLGEDSRTERAWDIIMARLDFREMSKRILGSYWTQNVDKQEAFVAEFAKFMKRTFLKKVDQIKDTTVIYHNEEIRGSTAKVSTSIYRAGGVFNIKFHMYRFESQWKIYDVLLDNESFSIIRSYRTQMHWLLQAISFEELLHIIRAKNS
jgi:ABC-type transporter MlaC component